MNRGLLDGRLLLKKHDGGWRARKITFLAINFFHDDRNMMGVVNAVVERSDRIAESVEDVFFHLKVVTLALE